MVRLAHAIVTSFNGLLRKFGHRREGARENLYAIFVFWFVKVFFLSSSLFIHLVPFCPFEIHIFRWTEAGDDYGDEWVLIFSLLLSLYNSKCENGRNFFHHAHTSQWKWIRNDMVLVFISNKTRTHQAISKNEILYYRNEKLKFNKFFYVEHRLRAVPISL